MAPLGGGDVLGCELLANLEHLFCCIAVQRLAPQAESYGWVSF